MITIEKWDVYGFEAAIRGMRNPMNSWEKGDTVKCASYDIYDADIGPKDMALARKLIKAGSDHRKFMRMIHVWVDITAPLYWWKEFDTYKVGTVSNSCSTMHKIHEKEFTINDFSYEHLLPDSLAVLEEVIHMLNVYREAYTNNSFDISKIPWWQMIQLLPSSYNQKRTINMNYETLYSIYFARKDHKLDEWHDFCDWILKLPYMQVCFIGGESGCTSAEPKKGQWVFKRLYHEADECICSECGQLMTTAHEKRMRFCPNCGAKMEVTE